MLKMSIQLSGSLFTYIASLSLRTTGNCFLYAFLSRLPFVRCSLGDNWFVNPCNCDYMLYFWSLNVAFCYFIETCLSLNNFNLLFCIFCNFGYIIRYLNLAKDVLYLLVFILINLSFFYMSCYGYLNVLYNFLSIQLNNKHFKCYYGAY